MLKAVLSRYDFAVEEFGRPVSFIIYDEDLEEFDTDDFDVFMQMSTEEGEVITEIESEDKEEFVFTDKLRPDRIGLHRIRFKLVKEGSEIYTDRIRVVVV
jgi:hypothetical protein